MFFYRKARFWKTLKTLYTLPPEKVDAFVNAYDIFEHDWQDEDKLIASFGEDYYVHAQQKVYDWYYVLNLLCSLGPLEKLYIPPAMDPSKGLLANQDLFEERLMIDLNIEANDGVLDLGCGRGRVVQHIASKTKANVTGINLDDSQIAHAKTYAKNTNVSHLTTFMELDMNEYPLPFEDQLFNAAYAIQSITYAKDKAKTLKELHRILKPGGRVAILGWVTLKNYDPKNKHHVEIVNKTKPLVGAVGTLSKEEFSNEFENAGFNLLYAGTLSVDGIDSALISNATKKYKRINKVVDFLVKIKVFPYHFKTLYYKLNSNVDEFMEVDRLKLATINNYFLVEKNKEKNV